MIWQATAYGQNILQLLPGASLQFFTQAHKISVLTKKRNSCSFGLANFFPPPATSRGSSIVGSSHSPPNVLHSSPAHSWARGKISYIAAAARYTANHPQHSRNTTRYTTQGQHFGSGQKNWLVFSFHSLKASKFQNAAPASSSVVLRVVLCGASTQHWSLSWASLKRILLPPSSWSGSHFAACQRCFAQLVLQYSQI